MAFTVFSPNTVIRSSEINENFNLKADLASPTFTGTLTAALIVANTLSASTIVGTTITGTSIVGTTITATDFVTGSFAVSQRSVTAAHSLTSSDCFVYADASAAAYTITFPAASTCTKKVYAVKKTDSTFNAVTLSGTGMTTNYLKTIGETAWFQSDGAAWNQVHRKTDVPWTTFTPTGTFTNCTYTGKWRRAGDSIQMQILCVQTAAPGAATLSINIVNSSSWTIDSAKMLQLSSDNFNYGFTTIQDAGVAYYHGAVRLNNTTQITATVGVASGTYFGYANVTQAVPISFAINDSVSLVTSWLPITDFSA